MPYDKCKGSTYKIRVLEPKSVGWTNNCGKNTGTTIAACPGG